LANESRPAYLRLAREATPVLTTEATPFEIGKAYLMREGGALSIISTGTMTYKALMAARQLANDGIEVDVLHVPTIKPLDAVAVLKSASKTGVVITIEEAQINGGLGGAVSELLAEHKPTHVFRMGMNDHFGESGTPDELFEQFGLSIKHIVLKTHSVLSELKKQ
jgi:transketolase